MTTFFIILVLLLTGCLVRGATEDIIAMSGYSKQLKAESVKKATSCVLTTNQGEVLDYVPNQGKITSDIDASDWSGGMCSVTIRPNRTHAGMWQITAKTARDHGYKTNTLDDNATAAKTFAFNLYVQETVDLPFEYVKVYEGHYVNIKHVDNYENLNVCNLTGPEGKSMDLLAETQEDFQLFGQCGVSMKAHVNLSGSWKLVAVDNNFTLYVASFSVQVYQLEKIKQPDPSNMLVLQWIRGKAGVIKLPVDTPKICQIMDPDGVIVAISYDKCYYEVQVATALYEGIWLARYNVYGMLEPVELQFEVKTVDSITLSTNVNYTEDTAIRLLCRLDVGNEDSLQSCSFVRPDNRTIYLTPTVANERYSSYISPAYGSSSKVLECGITIREPASVDYGTWRCDLGVGYSMDVHGSVLHVDQSGSRKRNDTNAKSRTVETKVDNVHVKRGDPFTIKCSVDFALKYCWLRSPNGTAYSITQDKNVQNALLYKGDGLPYGQCGVQISAADDSDNGPWSCFMGMMDDNEEKATVSVTVTESYLVAKQTEIAVSPRNDPVLSCHILPRMLDRTVHYCRWIRPDGYGIYNDISHRYTANSSYSQCRLVILNYSSKEDAGRWTCVAGLMGRNDQVEEASAYIKVLPPAIELNMSISSITIMLFSLLLIMVSMFMGFFVVRNIMRKKRTPILQNPQKYSIWNSFQSQFFVSNKKRDTY